MTDLQKQSLKEIYETASEAQKKSLMDNFPEVFALQNDVWYTYTDCEGYLIKFTDVGKKMAFGFSAFTGWTSEPQKWTTEYLVEATLKQIEDVLKEAAKQMGLTDGQRVIENGRYYSLSGTFCYSVKDDAIYDEHGVTIFDGREWIEKGEALTLMPKYKAEQMFNIKIID